MMSETRHSPRCSRASGSCEVSLGLFLPVAIAGLMFGASCGAPDEIVRHAGPTQAGGNSSSSSAVGTGGAAGSTAQPSGGVSSQGGASGSGGAVGTGGKSSTGGDTSSGGTTRTGGRSGSGGITTTGGKSGSGGITTTGGKSGSGGTTATGGAGGIGATGGVGSGGKSGGGADGGVGGASGTGGFNPFGNGGSTNGGAGGTRTGGVSGGGNGGGGVATGGSLGGGGDSGGAGGSTSTAPASGLQVWVAQKTTGATGQIGLNLRIDNKTSQTVDMSTVTLRYWYQDESLGSAVVVATNYVSIGYSNLGKVTGCTVVAVPSPVADADHYLELSFSGTLAVQGDKATNDQFNVQVTLHTASYTGTVDVTNDYSYDGGATGLYEKKITLHDKSGNVIWGTPPGKG